MVSTGTQTPAAVESLPNSSLERLYLSGHNGIESQLASRLEAAGYQTRSPSSVNGMASVSPPNESVAGQAVDDTATSSLHAGSGQPVRRRPSGLPTANIELGTPEGSPVEINSNRFQGKPPELANLLAEIVFVLICSMGQLLFAFFLGNITVNQLSLLPVLGINSSQTSWLVGAFLLANGLSVVISGSLADLAGPKTMMVSAFVWLTIWNTVGVFSLTPSRAILFFIVRAMQGLAVGVLVSASMSVLGRIYKPGMRKTRVFSSMAAMAPFGFWIGCLQGGALSAHLPWVFGSSAILCGLCAIAGYLTIPSIKAAADRPGEQGPSIKNFDFPGAALAVAGCGCTIFGLTQGAPSNWSPYTYSLIIVGLLFFVGFYFAERRAPRPLIDNRLWLTPGFAPLALSYFLGFGAYVGAWQFYAVRFWLTLQGASPLTVALYLTPNAIVGVLATWIVSKTLHIVPGHWILTASMVAFALGPVFFLPQTASTSYWALSMPGIALVTFGPDLSFAAASIFITSSVAKSFQGSAGSVLVTIQNLTAAIMTAVGDTIGQKVSRAGDGELDIDALRAIWWFSFATSLVGAAICAVAVRIPKSEEKEHIS